MYQLQSVFAHNIFGWNEFIFLIKGNNDINQYLHKGLKGYILFQSEIITI